MIHHQVPQPGNDMTMCTMCPHKQRLHRRCPITLYKEHYSHTWSYLAILGQVKLVKDCT